MAANSTPKAVYPLATRKGSAIPLDVAMPISAYPFELSEGSTEFTVDHESEELALVNVMTEDYAWFYVEGITDSSVFVEFALAPNVMYDLIIPSMPGGAHIIISGVYGNTMKGLLNFVQRWTQLDNQNFGAS